MAKSLNRFEAIGNLGKDPITKFLPDGTAVANFSIACSESYKNKNTGEQVENTEWINCVAWRKLAEIIEKYLHKGSKVWIEGKYTTRKWQDKNGADQWTTEIVVSNMLMLDGKPASGAQNNPAQHASGNVNQPNPTYGGSAGQTPDPDFDQDIPF